MTFTQALISARSYIVFILALIAGFTLVYSLDQWDPAAPGSSSRADFEVDEEIPSPSPAPLTPRERDWAAIAWKYFEHNLQPETGLVNSTDAFPSTTMWDTGSYLLALVAAHRLGLIDEAEAGRRVVLVAAALERMPLFEGALPNKAYHAATLQMTTYGNEPSERGIGWSAIDLGRLLVPLNILAWTFPEHAGRLRAAVARWQIERALQDGQLFGAEVDAQDRTRPVQEGRVGYEQYAAKGFSVLGLAAPEALEFRRHLRFVEVEGLQIPVDTRDPSVYAAHDYVLSEPYMLTGLEFGWDEDSRALAWRIYRAQQKRFERTGVLTAVTEDHLDRAPYFVYNTVYTTGKAWNAITERGEDASAFKTLSTKAVFAWHALYRTAYTERMLEATAQLHDPQKGWYAGVYEKDGTTNAVLACNTNAVILESLAFRSGGRLLRLAAR
jgi:hypothetical protein